MAFLVFDILIDENQWIYLFWLQVHMEPEPAQEMFANINFPKKMCARSVRVRQVFVRTNTYISTASKSFWSKFWVKINNV